MTSHKEVGAQILDFRAKVKAPAMPDVATYDNEDRAILPDGSVYSVDDCGTFRKVA